MDTFFVVKWKDQRLRWPDEWSNDSEITLDPSFTDLLWIPDVYITGARRTQIHNVLKQTGSVRLRKDLTIRYSTRLSMEIGCDLDFSFYPMDFQNCVIVLESYGFRDDEMIYLWEEPGLEILKELNIPQFNISVTHGISGTFGNYGSAGLYPRLNATVHFQRTMRYHIMQTFIPSTIYVVMSWISFCIDPRQLPARMVLTVTTVLTVSNQYSSLRESLPPVSYIKAIDIWMLTCLLFVISVLIEFGVVIAILRWSKCETNVLPLESPVDSTFKENMSVGTLILSDKDENVELTYKKREQLAWKIEKIFRIVIPILFLCFALIYWPYYMLKSGRWTL
ncbi:GLRA3 (predicted) [Pycnogonum litorale]